MFLVFIIIVTIVNLLILKSCHFLVKKPNKLYAYAIIDYQKYKKIELWKNTRTLIVKRSCKAVYTYTKYYMQTRRGFAPFIYTNGWRVYELFANNYIGNYLRVPSALHVVSTSSGEQSVCLGYVRATEQGKNFKGSTLVVTRLSSRVMSKSRELILNIVSKDIPGICYNIHHHLINLTT